MRNLFKIFWGICYFILSACGEDDDASTSAPTLDKGTASISVTGSVTNDFEGEAIFSNDVIQNQAVEGSKLQIFLFNSEDSKEYVTLEVTVREDMDGVDAGVYTVNVSSSTEPSAVIYYTTPNDDNYIATTTGTIEVNGVNEESVWGRFSGKLVDIQNRSLEISGEFHAEAN